MSGWIRGGLLVLAAGACIAFFDSGPSDEETAAIDNQKESILNEVRTERGFTDAVIAIVDPERGGPLKQIVFTVSIGSPKSAPLKQFCRALVVWQSGGGKPTFDLVDVSQMSNLRVATKLSSGVLATDTDTTAQGTRNVERFKKACF